jgi:putative transposase
VSASFERFCLAADAGRDDGEGREEACGPRHARGEGEGRCGHRWGRTRGKIGFHGGKVDVVRPRVRELDGKGGAGPETEE